MNTEVILELLIIQIIVIIFIITSVLVLIKTRNNIKLEKKFSKYTISPLNNNDISLFDKIEKIFNSMVKKTSKLLSKTKLFDSYAARYEKHISYDKLKTTSSMDFISKKIFVGLFFTLLYLIAEAVHYNGISFLAILLSFLFGFFILDVFIQYKFYKNKKQIEEDLLKAVIIMNNAFQSGRSMVQSIEIVKEELTGPISDEFKKIYLDISYGLSLETVFERFYNRVKIEDVKYITSSLILLNKTGGNIIKVFGTIEREFFNKKKLMNELKTMTASSNFVFRILLVLPFALYIIIFFLNPEYFAPLFKTSIGLFILLIILLLYIGYILLIRKILKVNI